ncbi:hypothetical protein [Lacimicrobium alkaliphilum]|uniref:DUF2262 domain-containing protein n=1 Tax=Lacimicrobium alkaliphilum TaxID=1526571 RepID=A0ABQ1R968_9ALTE|nr:hypothetical protein [Lacimicrobium alkaliphilum]GGD62785.1 hypothetical protein GCM10011357_17600 [Lacimicrobium alkaliphilum]
MQFLKKLFGKKEEPESTVTIECAGSLEWDAESDYWVGTHSGTTISVAYDGLSKPNEDLARFVTQTIGQQNFLENTVSEIKSVARAQYPENRHPEIEELRAKDVVFQDPNFILIQFFGPEDHEPFWFAEIHGSKIFVGCDT